MAAHRAATLPRPGLVIAPRARRRTLREVGNQFLASLGTGASVAGLLVILGSW